ncbi:HNH endonuclease domain-containing protein [Streptomyces sp. DSM 44917]|uniref:HNH endonuclease domain-containing protein n=1 Tax=Streptomyces boetiae TaxID=3075541 RepID=A0ABU2L8Y8_9ACTN|nr:HNH endonuclease [Streptomyces sp. DSM 44917]MDT0308042.1 HNH endonuclease domain-containing protein [Streptomyces sp. DSM 44917]
MGTGQHRARRNGAAKKRARKAAVAARDGARCAYCRIPFTDLRQATLDHVVPHSLYATWAARHLVLACNGCNQAKADRLPLLLALALLAAVNTGQEAMNTAPGTVNTGQQPVNAVQEAVNMSQGTVNTLRLLARLAHHRYTADRAAWRARWEVAA